MIRLARAPPGTAVESHALGACAVTSPHPWAVIALGRLTGCSLARLPPLLTRCVCSTCCVCSLNHCSLICLWLPFASLVCVDALDPDPHPHLVPNARPSHGPLPDPKQSRKPNARHLHLHLHRRMKNTILTAGFAFFTVLPMYTSFPLATVPSMLGKNFGRAYAAWTLLGTAACWSLTDAAREGKKRMDDPVFKALGGGIVAWSALHLACTGLKLVLEWGELARWYPATFAKPLWSLASLALFSGALIPVPSLGSITGVAWR
mmetsp:Transcript_106904/g.310310  ORF Transcript_106904/g.310310 Transcript_106904/m.310310 type:complete len:262 (+) Transcript_106904:795-1580(+)